MIAERDGIDLANLEEYYSDEEDDGNIPEESKTEIKPR